MKKVLLNLLVTLTFMISGFTYAAQSTSVVAENSNKIANVVYVDAEQTTDLKLDPVVNKDVDVYVILIDHDGDGTIDEVIIIVVEH